MKNTYSNFRKFLLLIVVFLIVIFTLSLSSCAVQKKDKTTETKETSNIEKKKDSSKTVETSGAIHDRITINTPASDNVELMRMFNEMMSKMNTSKSSGSNSYSSRYDEANKQWVIDFLVAQTKNETTAVKEDTKSEKTFEQNIDEYVKKIVIPWWVYVIGFLFAWPYIKGILSFFIPGFSQVTTIQDFKRKLRNNEELS